MAEKRLRYAFIGDAKSLISATRKSDTALGKFSRGIGKVGVAAAQSFAVVGTAAIAMGAKALTVASDAEEAGAAFETTFGQAAQDTGKFVEEFANKAGLASFELKQLLATSGAVLQGINFTAEGSANLSTKLATLAGDVASFSNVQGGAKPVLEAFTKALLGERESLKTYGIAILEADVKTKAFAMTGKTSAAELTKQEKALATYELLLEKTTVQQGDLNRTQDGFANASRRVQAELKELQVQMGNELLPIATELMPVFSELITALGTGLTPVMKEIAPVIQRLVDIFNILAPVLLPLLAKGFEILAFVLEGTVKIAETQVAVYEALTTQTKELNSFTHDYIGTQKELTKGLENTSFSAGMLTAKERALEIQMARSIAMDAFYLQQHKDRIKASNDLQVEVQNEDDMIGDLIRTNQANTDAIRNQAEEIQNSLLPNLSALVSARNRIIAIQEKEENATKALTRAKTDLIEAGQDLLDIDDDIERSNRDLEDANSAIEQAEKDLTEAKVQAAKVTDEERLAILRQEEAVNQLIEAQDGSEIKTLELAIARERLNELNNEATSSNSDVEDAERKLTQAKEEAVRVEEKITDLLEQKEKLRLREIQLADVVKERQEALNKVSKNNIDVLIALAEAQERYNDALLALGDGKMNAAFDKVAKLTETTSENVESALDNMGIDTGGDKITSKPPKVVDPLAGFNARQAADRNANAARGLATAGAMGGASRFGETTINFNGNVGNEQDAANKVVEALKRYEKTNGNLSRTINLN